jgi:hypothetical protein
VRRSGIVGERPFRRRVVSGMDSSSVRAIHYRWVRFTLFARGRNANSRSHVSFLSWAIGLVVEVVAIAFRFVELRSVIPLHIFWHFLTLENLTPIQAGVV